MFALLIGCIAAFCFDAGSLRVAGEQPGRLYGALEMSPEHAVNGRKAGWNVAMVPVSWSRFEPRPGFFDQKYIDEVLAKKQALLKLGYKLQIDLGVQYPPAWVADLPQGRYKNQYGDLFISRQPGEDLPNVVFNAGVRAHMAAYFDGVFTRLGTDWDYVRLGCARFGELNYPRHKFGEHGNCYWAFDDLAQGKTAGLPEGVTACPVPGWIPGTISQSHDFARKFIGWYLDCLKNYQEWQIATVRKRYGGDICMLYGSWGLRPGWLEGAIAGDLDGRTSCERNGEIQQGFDWSRMISSIRDPRVIVYCTWIDGTIKNKDICDDDSADPARWSPVHWQSNLARVNPLRLRVWGENTGGNNLDAMRLTFDRIRRFDLMGIMWAFDSELYADPSHGFATFENYSAFIPK